ncbi:hypothetical protein [Streptomyces sp. H39-S7]|uniref:hypothetical protein n=1 Tax=Streptomyces sp. H39-S7 TaxID=3004357 RepID=UPI0022AEFCF1|nr:hypothetical protein [Streptomyces sp. H39-S7]MCZ4125578.1 hypothetical protein [Streptomyces sp. H39-S7]
MVLRQGRAGAADGAKRNQHQHRSGNSGDRGKSGATGGNRAGNIVILTSGDQYGRGDGWYEHNSNQGTAGPATSRNSGRTRCTGSTGNVANQLLTTGGNGAQTGDPEYASTIGRVHTTGHAA